MNSVLEKVENNKQWIAKAANVAWPAILESFFVALVALVDSYMVSELGAASVAAVGLTTQPKMVGLAVFFVILLYDIFIIYQVVNCTKLLQFFLLFFSVKN